MSLCEVESLVGAHARDMLLHDLNGDRSSQQLEIFVSQQSRR